MKSRNITNKRTRLVLKSKQCRLINTMQRCNECNLQRAGTWLYKKSNIGSVNLCRFCRPKILERSFGKIDALNMAIHYGHYRARKVRF